MTEALDVNYAASLSRAKTAKQYPRQTAAKPRGQVIDATNRFVSNKRRRQPTGTPSRNADVIPLNAAEVPKARNPVDEMAFKQEMAKKRHMDQMRAQHFALPPELNELTKQLDSNEHAQAQDWYKDELEQGGLGDVIKEQLDKKFAKPVRDAIDKRIDELKKKAAEKVKEKIKEAFGKEVKKIAGKGVQKTIWSAIDQGAIVEVEGAALESWFGSGTLLTAYQGLTGALHGGKPMIPEGTILSFLEPPPLQTPSGKAPGSVTEGAGMLIALYDLIAWPLSILYIFLLVIIILLIHIAIASQLIIPALITAAATIIYSVF